MAKTKNKALDLFVDSASYQRTSLFDETETTPKRMGRPPKNENKKFSRRITILLTEDQHQIIEQRRGSGRYDEIDGAKFVRDWLRGTGMFDRRTIKKYPHDNIPKNEPIE